MRTGYKFAEPPYSLHDCPVRFLAAGNKLTLETEYGMKLPEPPYVTDSGRVELHGLDWDFCWAYILSEAGSNGRFEGEKLQLADFFARCPDVRLEVIDEHYGYNKVRYCGFADLDSKMRELAVEIYCDGPIVYIAGK